MNMVGTDWIRRSNPRENQNVVLRREHIDIGVAHDEQICVYTQARQSEFGFHFDFNNIHTFHVHIGNIPSFQQKYHTSMSVEEQCEKVDDVVLAQWSMHDRLEHCMMMNLRHAETFQANADLLDRSQHSNTTNIKELNEALSANIGFEERVQKAEQELKRVKNELMQLRRLVLVKKIEGQQQVVLSDDGQNKLMAAIRDSRRFHMSLPSGGWGSHPSSHNRDQIELEQALQNEFAGIVFTASDFSQGTQL